MACWICTLGSAYSSTFDENNAIRYFQAFVKPLAICSALRVRRLPLTCCPDRAGIAADRPAPHRGTGPARLPPSVDDIGDHPEAAVRGDDPDDAAEPTRAGSARAAASGARPAPRAGGRRADDRLRRPAAVAAASRGEREHGRQRRAERRPASRRGGQPQVHVPQPDRPARRPAAAEQRLGGQRLGGLGEQLGQRRRRAPRRWRRAARWRAPCGRAPPRTGSRGSPAPAATRRAACAGARCGRAAGCRRSPPASAPPCDPPRRAVGRTRSTDRAVRSTRTDSRASRRRAARRRRVRPGRTRRASGTASGPAAVARRRSRSARST